MPLRAASYQRSHRFVRAAWLLVGVAALLLGIWSVSGPEARGSDVLIVIEDASETPTGMFPGTVCYKLIRNRDSIAVSEGCLAIAASISTPAGFDHNELYTLEVEVNHPRCRLLDEPGTGNGTVPFTIRVACDDPNDTSTDAVDSAGPNRFDYPFVAASASPIAVPETTGP